MNGISWPIFFNGHVEDYNMISVYTELQNYSKLDFIYMFLAWKKLEKTYIHERKRVVENYFTQMRVLAVLRWLIVR